MMIRPDHGTPDAPRAEPRRWIALAAVGLAAITAMAVGGWWSFFRVPPIVGFATGNGRIEATEIDVATRFAGRVEDVLAREGDFVEAGQVLARIDVGSLEAQLQEADAALLETVEAHAAAGAIFNRQESLQRLAKKELERAHRLFEADIASEDLLDQRQTELETASASVAQSISQIRQAERSIEVAAARVHRLHVDIEDATLVAPRPAFVLYRLAEPGEVLPAGGKVLSLIESGDSYMTIFLPARDAAQVRIGAEARLRLDGFPERDWPARVSYVAPRAQFTPKQVETASEREKLVFKIKVQLPNPVDPVIKPGMRGVAIIKLDPQARWPDRLP